MVNHINTRPDQKQTRSFSKYQLIRYPNQETYLFKNVREPCFLKMPSLELKIYSIDPMIRKSFNRPKNKRKFTQLIQDQETVQSAQNKRESSLNRSKIRRLFNRPKIKETHSIDPRSESCSIGPNQETIH